MLGIWVGIIFLLTYFYFNHNKQKFIKISLLISVPGYFFDTLLVYFQIYDFETIVKLGTLPLWMIVLWFSFSTLFDEILTFFKSYKILGIILSGFLGMALGMSLLLIALQKADAGIVATLSSTSPIMILFLLWIFTKKSPSFGAWCGTIVAIFGTGLIFIY